MGVTVGGIGLAATGYDHLVPYVHQPENVIPGVTTWYATSCRECPAGCGMLMRSRESRVVKCEGKPQHPINSGTLCARGQAAVQGLYDPDRARQPLRRTKGGEFRPASWNRALGGVGKALTGKRIAFMSDLQTGSLDTLQRAWLKALGSDHYLIYEPINYESVRTVSGGMVPSFDIARSDYLISFAADFLETWISPVEYAVAFAAMREVKNGTRGGFAFVGPRVSMTAANADRRLVIRPGDAEAVAAAIIFEAGRGGSAKLSAETVGPAVGIDPEDIREVARGLASAGAPLALPGLDLDSARAAALINQAFGSSLVNHDRPHAVSHIASRADVTSLIADMESGGIDVLVVSGANPVFGLPESARFVDALKRVPTVISLSSYMDETTARADWVLPSNTPLESWGDYSPYPDVTDLMQPTMGKVFNTEQTGGTLIELARRAGVDPMATFAVETFHEYVRQHWGLPAGMENALDRLVPIWETSLQKGGSWPELQPGGPVTPATGYNTPIYAPTPVRAPGPPAAAPERASAPGFASTKQMTETLPSQSRQMRLFAFPHIYYYDGRNANRRWLQEMPEPVTKAVWGSWVEVAPSTARSLGVSTDDIVEIASGDASIRVPVLVREGMAADTLAVPIGEGHTHYGRFAKDIGANVLPLLSEENPVVKVTATGDSKWLTRIKGSTNQHGREIVQTAALGEPFKREKEIIMPLKEGYKQDDFYPGHDHKKHRWAMVIDLDRCIGCHACSTACYAENNLAVLGPEGAYRRREMAWLRIDMYTDWSDKSAPILYQPMLCQHCDSAPCESVCPVFAAAHSDEGLNMQVYNRCIGTRYCSNNCPYKVRRFNWYDYDWPEPLNWQLNPDVTVRSRGVMEKCTFCIQRIRQAEIAANRDGRAVADGEITPACAQTCPTGVFTFGDLKDPNSKVSHLIRTDPRAYQVLSEVNTKPAVIYLKTVVKT